MATIGIDVGGTKISGVVFDNNKIKKCIRIETQKTKQAFTNQIISLLDALDPEKKIKQIGLGFPGILDRKKGVVIRMINIPEIKEFPIAKIIQKERKAQVKIEKDANCMALSELYVGLGKDKKNFIALTIGTGIGGGVIINKKLHIGRGSATELGHVNIEPEGFKCSCGSKGCLEEYASGRAIVRYAKEKGLEKTSPKDVEILARAGNLDAKEIYQKVGYYLGVGISTMIVAVDPEAVILSGSISRAADLFLKETKEEIEKRVFFGGCPVLVSKLEESPAIGAACLFKK